MNMPFELGIDYGTRLVGSPKMRRKKFLILERDPHRFRKAISDLSGVDIKHHNTNPEDVVRAARDWFTETVGLKDLASGTLVWWSFSVFTKDFYKKRKADGFTAKDLNMMPIREYVRFIKRWVAKNPLPKSSH